MQRQLKITIIMTALIDIKLNPVSEVDAIHYYKDKIMTLTSKNMFSTYSHVFNKRRVFRAHARVKFMGRHGWSGISQRSEIALDIGAI
jgi:hypothetical protein